MFPNNSNDMARVTVDQMSIPSAAYTADITGAEVNCSQADRVVEVVVHVGVLSAASAGNEVEFTVTQSDATGGTFDVADSSQYDPTGTAAVPGTAWDRKLDATTEGTNVYRFNFILVRAHCFLKVVAPETGTFDGIFSASIRFIPRTQPAMKD